tara:strand:+ start:2642 stop:3169 length:528 start_codon:yes stop_codon:yes gene_type:complete
LRLSRFVIPLALFVTIVVFSFFGLEIQDRDKLPSALIDKPFPEFAAASLFDPTIEVKNDALLGRATLVNVWATWCPTCKAEHDELIRISEDTQLQLIGINYKDDPVKARQWLSDQGNPFDLVLQDPEGDLGIELGVYGAPETFLLDESGRVLYKRVGAITREVWSHQMLPFVDDL